MDRRPAIPADIKRRVLLEAGHRCAIPTCRHIYTELHHIIPWETCQTHDYENLIALCPNCHIRADRGDIDRKSLRAYKARLRFAHDKFSNAEMDLMFMLANGDPNSGIIIAAHMDLLFLRILQAGYIRTQAAVSGGVGVWSFGKTGTKVPTVDMTPRIATLTDTGRAFVASFIAGAEEDPERLA